MGDFMGKIQARRIDSKYSLVRKIGEGGYGAVYLGMDSTDAVFQSTLSLFKGQDFETGEQVALKLVHRFQDFSSLKEEVERYDSFRGLPGFPELYSYCSKDDYQVMVFELLGPSLEDLFVFCDRQFSLKTTLLLMDQLLSRFEDLHSQGWLHRDVKPQNCLMGTGRNGNIVYLTDFGLSREVMTAEEAEQLLRRPHFVGTTRYASIRGHSGQAQSRGDDLESLGYMMIYLSQGRLPWQGLKAHGSVEKDRLVVEKKKALTVEELCRGLPPEFADYMRYVKGFALGRRPNYAKLRRFFRRVAHREGIKYDDVFDWTVLMYLQQEEKQGSK